MNLTTHHRKWPSVTIIMAMMLPLTSCSIPTAEVSTFATSSSNLLKTYNSEISSLVTRADKVINLGGSLKKEAEGDLNHLRPVEVQNLLETRKQSIDKMVNTAKEIKNEIIQTDELAEKVLIKMVAYSETLVSLAQAGTKGSEAAKTLGQAINGFADLAGIAIPGAGAAGNMFEIIIEKVGDVVTRVQARRGLRDAVQEAQPFMDNLSTALTLLFSRPEANDGAARDIMTMAKARMDGNQTISNFSRMADAIAISQNTFIRNEAGRKILGTYNILNRKRNEFYRGIHQSLINAFKENKIVRPCYQPDGNFDESNCNSLREFQVLQLYEQHIERLKPEVDAVYEKIKETGRWVANRKRASNQLARAVREWASVHKKIGVALEQGSFLSTLSFQAILSEIQSLPKE